MLNSVNSMRRSTVSEALKTIEEGKQDLWAAEIRCTAGVIAVLERETAKAEQYFERALFIARATAGKVLGTPGGDEHGAALARSGQAEGGP